jgi:hypothetical protein
MGVKSAKPTNPRTADVDHGSITVLSGGAPACIS